MASRRGRLILATVLATIGLVGCSSQDPTDQGGAYSAEFRSARQQATSDFERAVLEDSQISRSEYDEAVHRLVKCAQGRGVKITTYDVGGIYNYSTSSPSGDQVMSECSIGTTIIIEALYNDMRMNPNNENIYQLQVTCLHRHGLAPDSFTGKDFEHALSSDENARSALPFDLDDEAVRRCMNDPVSG